MTTLALDLRAALRTLVRSPWSSFGVIAILALALGASTAILSLLDQVFMRSVPGERPYELMRVYGDLPERRVDLAPLSVTKFTALREQQTAFVGVAADAGATFTLTGSGEPVELNGYRVTSNYFEVLGIKPELGRAFRPEEEAAGEAIIVISHELWQRLFDGAPDVIGKPLLLNGVPHTVVGILPPQPRAWFGGSDIWATRPFEDPSYPKELLQRGVSFLRVLARVRPGVTRAQAEAALTSIQVAYRLAYPENVDAAWRVRVRTLADEAVGALRPVFSTLLAAVVLVLLIASSNATNLLMMRFGGRARELAVRRALGASKGAVLRILLVEGAVHGLIAGGLGAAMASLLLRTSLLRVASGPILGLPADLRWEVLALGLGIAVVCGVLAALLPALRLAHAEGILQRRGAGPERGETRARSGLLAGQVALSFALLVAALLLVESLTHALSAPVGFESARVLTASISLPASRYSDRSASAIFAERWLDKLRSSPGVEVAAVAQGLALTGHDRRSPFARADGQVPPLKDRPLALVRSVTPGYFAALGITRLVGRDFDARDRAETLPTVILSRGAVSSLFPEGSPLGRHLLLSSEGGGLDVEVVGVVGDVRSISPELENPVEFYRPLAQRPSPYLQVAVRSSGEIAGQMAILRKALREIDPQLPLNQPAPMSEVLSNAVVQRRLLTWVMGTFAALAVLLASAGVGGVAAEVVARRRGEIGVRLALGATPAAVRRMLVRQGLRPVIWGLAAGLVALVGLVPAMRSQLYATRAWEPRTVGGSAVLVLLAAAFACWLPARRAERVDPAESLRDE